MNDEIKRPKKDFKVEFNISWVVGTIFAVLSSLLGTFQYKFLSLLLGIVSIICFVAAVYFYVTKPKPLTPSIAWIDLDED